MTDARDALADLAKKFIIDRPLRSRKAFARHKRSVVVVAEDGDDIAGLRIRNFRDVQHAHVHADPSDNGNQFPAQIEACLSGQQAAQAVGIADGQDGDAGIMRRSVKPSVADIRPGRDSAHLRDHGMQRHHGPQADRALQLLRRRVAVGDDAGAHHVERELRVQDRRAGVAAVADLRLDSGPLHGAEHVHEALVLQSCKRNVFLCPAVGDAEVHENALNVQMRQRRDLLQFVQRSVVVIGKEADARHAGIKLEMDIQNIIRPRQRFVQFLRVSKRMHLLRNIEEDHIRGVLRRRIAQDQNRQAHLAAPDLYGLLQIGNGQILRAEIGQRSADRHGPVAVGIGLHHAEKARTGRQMCPNRAVVIFQIVERDVRPCSFECLHIYSSVNCVGWRTENAEISVRRTIRPSKLISARTGVSGSCENHVSTTSSFSS